VASAQFPRCSSCRLPEHFKNVFILDPRGVEGHGWLLINTQKPGPRSGFNAVEATSLSEALECMKVVHFFTTEVKEKAAWAALKKFITSKAKHPRNWRQKLGWKE